MLGTCFELSMCCTSLLGQPPGKALRAFACLVHFLRPFPFHLSYSPPPRNSFYSFLALMPKTEEHGTVSCPCLRVPWFCLQVSCAGPVASVWCVGVT